MSKGTEKELNRIISKADMLWTKIKEYDTDIIDFLSENIETENTNKILHISLKLVISELMLNQEKYEIKDYTFEEFTGLIDEYSIPDIKDKIKTEKFIKETRDEIWGYVKKYYKELIDLLLSIKSGKTELIEKEYNLLSLCLCVVFIETKFRERELYFLES